MAVCQAVRGCSVKNGLPKDGPRVGQCGVGCAVGDDGVLNEPVAPVKAADDKRLVLQVADYRLKELRGEIGAIEGWLGAGVVRCAPREFETGDEEAGLARGDAADLGNARCRPAGE